MAHLAVQKMTASCSQDIHPSIFCIRFKLLRVTWGLGPSQRTLGKKQVAQVASYTQSELTDRQTHFYSFGEFTSTPVHLATVKLMQPNAVNLIMLRFCIYTGVPNKLAHECITHKISRC